MGTQDGRSNVPVSTLFSGDRLYAAGTAPEARPIAARKWTALVLAGRRPGVDPLAASFGVANKALVAVRGEPMLGRVVRALLRVEAIGRVRILAQEPLELRDDPRLVWLADEPRVAFVTSTDSICGSIVAATCRGQGEWPVLVTTADHALLTPAMIEQFLDASSGADLAVGLVERGALLACYPDSRRTWLRFRGGAYTGANLFALNGREVQPILEFWSTVEADRKRGLRLIARFGPWLLLRALTRTLSINTALMAAASRFGATAKPVMLSEVEAGIDVDKVGDHALAEAIIAGRERLDLAAATGGPSPSLDFTRGER